MQQFEKLMYPLRILAIAGNILFILWILFNAMDSGWKGTVYQILSAVVLIALLLVNTYFISGQLKRGREGMLRKVLDHKMLLLSLAVILLVLIGFGVYQVRLLHKAHSSFANYYSFRGCTQLLEKTPTYGICKTASGQTIKIVSYQGKWYLDGDLPKGLWGHLN